MLQLYWGTGGEEWQNSWGKRRTKKNRDISYTKEKGGLIHIAMSLNMGNPDTPSGKKILMGPSLYHFPLPHPSSGKRKNRRSPRWGEGACGMRGTGRGHSVSGEKRKK